MKRVVSFLLLVLFAVQVWAMEVDSFLIKARFNSLKSPIAFGFNKEVVKLIANLTENEATKTATLIYESHKYLPYVEQVIASKKMPKVLAYLPYVVSGYANQRNSEDGRAGVWNLPYAVARKYDVLMNSYIDERYNVTSSTDAAMDYLADLKVEFTDWRLAILAFCTSPTAVLQHINKLGTTKTYDGISVDLSPVEKHYIEQFAAITYVYSFYKENDIALEVKPFEKLIPVDTVDIFRKLTFDRISNATGIDRQLLRTLNPIYKLETVPFNEAPHSLIIPKGYKETFDSLLQNYPNLEAVKPAIDSPVILHDSDIAKIHPVNPNPPAKPSSSKVAVSYKVKSGDNLYAIADLFDCTPAELKRWNKMTRNYLVVGQNLVFYVPAAKKAKYQKMNALTAKQKKILIYQD